MRNIFLCLILNLVALVAAGSSVVFHGGAGTVGGSCATVKSGDCKVLVDCGTAYGAEYAVEGVQTNSGTVCGFPFDVKGYGNLIITHAHQDHAGRVPELFNAGFTGTVWTTEATKELLGVSWKSQVIYDTCTVRDWRWTREGKKGAARVHWHKDCEWSKRISPERLGTYTGIFEDVQALLRKKPVSASYAQACGYCQDLELRDVMKKVKSVPFDKPVKIGAFEVTFNAVKHLPGAASVRMTDAESSIVFSGDLGTCRSHLVKSIDPVGKADALFVECTYGDAAHGSKESVEAEYEKFTKVIGDTVKAGGVAWIPAFALDRSQRVLFEVKKGMDAGVIPYDTPIYFLSPSARDFTELYVSHPQWFDMADEMEPMKFFFKQTRKTFSMKLKLKKGAILLTTSGNMSTGSSLKYLPDLLPKESTTLCLVGYQTPGTYGHQLQKIARGTSNAKSIRLREGRFSIDVPVNARIYDFGCFSGHADAREIDDWLSNNNDSQVLLVHGDMNALNSRADALRKRGVKTDVVEPGKEYSFSKSVGK